MLKQKLAIMTFLLIANSGFGQDEAPPTESVNVEVLTESLQITNKAQIISVRINCESVENVQFLSMKFSKSDAVWSVVSARLNDGQLWLIKADTEQNTEKVMAWNYDSVKKELLLYPGNWPAGYSLDVDIQVNFTDLISLKDQNVETIISEINLDGTTFRCSEVGRGSTIDLR